MASRQTESNFVTVICKECGQHKEYLKMQIKGYRIDVNNFTCGRCLLDQFAKQTEEQNAEK